MIRVLAFNLTLLVLGILVVETLMSLFFDHRRHDYRVLKYVPELDLVTLAGNVSFEWSANVFTKPFSYAGIRKIRFRITTDEHGSRVGPDTQRDRPYDLVILGDSFSFGHHAAYGDSLQGLLEAGLPSYNIHNYAVAGSHSGINPKHFQYFSKQNDLRPNVIVMGIYVDMQIGDLPRRIATSKHGTYRVFNGIYVSPSRYREVTTSRLAAWLFEIEVHLRGMSSIYNVLFPPGASEEFAQSLYPDFAGADLDAYRRELLDTLAKIRALSELPQDHILIWLVPSNHEMKHYVERERESEENRRFNDRSQEFWTETIEVFRREGFPVVDPRSAFLDAFTHKGIYGFTVDGHFNAKGFSIAAEMILDRLRPLAATPAPSEEPGRGS